MDAGYDPSLRLSDEQLMLAYKHGEAAAFDQLYMRRKDSLYRYFVCHTGSESVSNELYQDVWEKVINGRKNYQATAKFSTWLFKIAHNRLVDYYRSQGRLNEFSEQMQSNAFLNRNSVSIGPLSTIQRKQLMACLKQKISELPANQREAFLLKEEGGFNLEQIAEICGSNRETIKSRLRYAVKTLRQSLIAFKEFVYDSEK